VLGQFGVACFGACGRAVRQKAGEFDAGEDACRCVHVRVCMYRGAGGMSMVMVYSCVSYCVVSCAVKRRVEFDVLRRIVVDETLRV
jgi:hypothetical protein